MSKKVFSFCCENGHDFEGWFSNNAEWQREKREGRLQCPICGSSVVEKRPSAPHFGRVEGTTRTDVAKDLAGRERSAHIRAEAAAMKILRNVADNAEDVGRRFPQAVREMHKGKTPLRLLKGECRPDEAEALREEGIAVMPLPDAVAKKTN